MTSPSQLTKLLESARRAKRGVLWEEELRRLCLIIERMRETLEYCAVVETMAFEVERPHTQADKALLDVERIAEGKT